MGVGDGVDGREMKLAKLRRGVLRGCCPACLCFALSSHGTTALAYLGLACRISISSFARSSYQLHDLHAII